MDVARSTIVLRVSPHNLYFKNTALYQERCVKIDAMAHGVPQELKQSKIHSIILHQPQ
jgi:hypothetical protein